MPHPELLPIHFGEDAPRPHEPVTDLLPGRAAFGDAETLRLGASIEA